MIAREIMQTGFHTLSPRDTIAEAVKQFQKATEDEQKKVFGLMVIDDKDRLSRHVDGRHMFLVGRHYHQQVVRLARNSLGERHRPGFARRDGLPDQLEVVVQLRCRIRQLQVIDAVDFLVNHRVIAARDHLQRHARVNASLERDPMVLG